MKNVLLLLAALLLTTLAFAQSGDHPPAGSHEIIRRIQVRLIDSRMVLQEGQVSSQVRPSPGERALVITDANLAGKGLLAPETQTNPEDDLMSLRSTLQDIPLQDAPSIRDAILRRFEELAG